MEYAILVLGALALWHFVFEGILAPALVLEERYKLFKLRDELRMLMIRRGDAIGTKPFRYMQDSLNGLIRYADRVDGTALIACNVRMRTDPGFRAHVHERMNAIETCQLPQVKTLRQQSTQIVSHLVGVNNGGWFVFLVPLALAWACYGALRQRVRALTSLSEGDLKTVAIPSPDRRLHAH